MIRLLPALSLLAFPLLPATAAQGASFDCAKAATPFEKAICADPDLSKADERLAKTYGFALAGLSDTAAGDVKKSQQQWLAYAQKACTQDNEAITSGDYDERMTWCLSMLFDSRIEALEMSRFQAGLRLYPVSSYASFPDSYRNEEPDFRWPVGQHELTVVQIDGDDEATRKLNAALMAKGQELWVDSDNLDGDAAEMAGGEDAATTITFKNGRMDDRLSFEILGAWYPHGAAHGSHSTSYLHYLSQEERFLRAEDLFGAKKWQAELAKIVGEALQKQLGPILFPDADEPGSLEDIVSDPLRWDFSNYLGLTIQFQPYEITAYAYGTPTVFILWDNIEPLLKEGNSIR